MNIDQSLFDELSFKLWLEEKTDGEVVGYGGNPCDCPLAKWLRNKLKFRVEIAVGFATIKDGSVPMFKPREHLVALPQWAINFVYDIDVLANARRSAGRLSSRRITKEDALNVLEKSRRYKPVLLLEEYKEAPAPYLD